MEKLKPMDVYSSDMAIPFEVAAYCRGRKLCPQAVNLRKALAERLVAKYQLAQAEWKLAQSEDAVASCIVAVQTKMADDPI